MCGLKFLFKSLAGMPVFKWIMIIVSAGLAVLPFVFHEEPGSEDYLFPKLFLFTPTILITEVGLICGCRGICSNKLMRSSPIAKELYTRSVPLFITILTVGASVVMMTAYFIFLGVIGAGAEQFSDTLICGAMFCFPILLISAFFSDVNGGGVMVIYAFFPLFLFVLCGGEKLQTYGPGAPLGAAAAIFAGAVIIGVGLMFLICSVRFKKSNVKIVQQMPVE